MSTADRSLTARGFSLGQLFRWLVYCAAYFTLLGSYRVFADPMFRQQPPVYSQAVILALCWLLLLWYLARRRHIAAIVVHVFPLALLLVLLAVLRDISATQEMFSLIMGTLYFSAGVSFPLSLVKSSATSLQRELSPRSYLLLNAAGASLVLAALCAAAPVLGGGLPQWRPAAFGAMFGAWIGLYQAVATSPQIAGSRILGLPLRPFVAAGFLFGVVGTIVYGIGSSFFFAPLPWLPSWLAPLLFGLPAALVCGLVARWRARLREARSCKQLSSIGHTPAELCDVAKQEER